MKTPRTEVVRLLCRYIDTHIDQRVTLDMLADQADMSPFHLQRLFKDEVGVTPRQYQEARRLQRFKQALHEGDSVTDATYAAGFGSSSRLYDCARQLGMTPAVYRARGAGEAIRFCIFDSVLGVVLLAATGKGLCRVALGESAAELEVQFRDEFVRADLMRDDIGLQTYAQHILAYLQGKSQSLDLPQDVRATAFQRRVWELLQSIPYGQTRSYSELAAQLGSPQAVRAVANACANNPLALVIPCHRVIQKGGKLAGYRWGLERKAKLLAQEKKNVETDESGD
ncbi:MAG: methylated-DNA--[protein]-cysteine S-methyltransferase [Burkholderiales bacterium]|nr:methylated-DNA--[protein]-cysteine S-methyltransferase [Burkholderiales bacterium]